MATWAVWRWSAVAGALLCVVMLGAVVVAQTGDVQTDSAQTVTPEPAPEPTVAPQAVVAPPADAELPPGALEHVLGLGFPTIGSIRYDDEGNLDRVSGFNLGLGWSFRYFTGDPWEPEAFNSYWGWGTIALIIPYVEFGFSYPIPISEGDRFLVIDFGLLYLIPYFQFSMYY